MYFLGSMPNYRNQEQKNTYMIALNTSEQWQNCCNGEMFSCESNAQFFIIGAKGSSTSLEKRCSLSVEFSSDKKIYLRKRELWTGILLCLTSLNQQIYKSFQLHPKTSAKLVVCALQGPHDHIILSRDF